MCFVSAIGAIGGSLLGGFLDRNEARRAQGSQQGFDERMSKEYRDWAERMSNTAYQRQKQDLETAGYNPLFAMQGGGASTPSASPPKSSPLAPSEWGHRIQSGVTTALETARVKKELDLADSQKNVNATAAAMNLANTDLTEDKRLLTTAQQHNVDEDTFLKAQQRAKTGDERRVVQESERKVKSEADSVQLKNEALKSQLRAIRNEADFQADKAKVDRMALPVDAILDRVEKGVGSAKGLRNLMRPNLNDLNSSDREELEMHRAGSRGVPVRKSRYK